MSAKPKDKNNHDVIQEIYFQPQGGTVEVFTFLKYLDLHSRKFGWVQNRDNDLLIL